jgi:hypothetical protein
MVPVEVPAQVADDGLAVPAARSVRRATARRASARRASARIRQGDDDASILGFLAVHPESTVGVLARSLNLDPAYVAACVTHLAGAGEIRKASHGYSTVGTRRSA